MAVGPSASQGGGRVSAPAASPAGTATAIVIATAPASDGRCAALLPWQGGTVLGRLLSQLAGLGIADVRVLTRPAFEQRVREAVPGHRVIAGAAASDDLREIAGMAAPGGADTAAAGGAETAGGAGVAAPGGEVLVVSGDIVVGQGALAELVDDPRGVTAALLGGSWRARHSAYRVRSRRGRVVSASSPFHAVYRPTASFLGAVKIAAADRPALAAAAGELAGLAADPPAEWRTELEGKAAKWRAGLWRATAAAVDDGEDADEVRDDLDDEDELPGGAQAPVARQPLSPEDEARLRDRLTAAPEETASLVLVGLVRSGTAVSVRRVPRMFWWRPLSPEAAAAAEARIRGYDDDRVMLDAAVKANDGFFATFLVSPYSRFIARWAARRGITPDQVTTASLAIGALAAAAFATGERWGLVAGALLLQAAFTTDCVDGQLARYTRTFSKFGAWLDSICDRAKEYIVFAGLAIGASRAGDAVWTLACTALALQTVRHFSDFAFADRQAAESWQVPQPPLARSLDAAGQAAADRRALDADAPPSQARPPRSRRVLGGWREIDRLPGARWVKRMAAFPIGERFAAISLTAAFFDPRVTFVVLLVWGGFAVAYTLGGRVLRSIEA